MAHFLDVTLESQKGREASRDEDSRNSSESLLEFFPISLSHWAISPWSCFREIVLFLEWDVLQSLVELDVFQ